MIELPDDFRDLLLSFADNEVEFVVVGGHAVAYYGYTRATKDLDVLVRTTPDNAKRVYKALAAFGAPLQAFEVGEEDFADYEGVLQLGVPPLRIDILTSVTGVSFQDAFENHKNFDLEGREIPIIGIDALLSNKRATDRNQDRTDVEALERILRLSR